MTMTDKEDVIIFDDGTTLGNELLAKEWAEGHTFTKKKVEPFQKGQLKTWLEALKNKGTPDNKQKVFFAFSTEEMIANGITAEWLQLRDKYPNLAVAFIYEGASLDSIQQKLGIKTERQLMNDDRRLLANVGISPNPNLSKQEDIIKEVKTLKEQAIKDGLIVVEKKTGETKATTSAAIEGEKIAEKVQEGKD